VDEGADRETLVEDFKEILREAQVEDNISKKGKLEAEKENPDLSPRKRPSSQAEELMDVPPTSYDIDRIHLDDGDEEGLELLKEYLRMQDLIDTDRKKDIIYDQVKDLTDRAEAYYRNKEKSEFASALFSRFFTDIDAEFAQGERDEEQKQAA